MVNVLIAVLQQLGNTLPSELLPNTEENNAEVRTELPPVTLQQNILAELFSSRNTTLETWNYKRHTPYLEPDIRALTEWRRKKHFFCFFGFGGLECSVLVARWSIHHSMVHRSPYIRLLLRYFGTIVR
jgi:hypothetical protein